MFYCRGFILDFLIDELLRQSRQCTRVEFTVKLINPKGITIGLTTGSQILKKNNEGKMQYRNDIHSNSEIYAINCQTCQLFSHRKWTNYLLSEKLKFEMNDTITIRLNMVHNHITIYKNNDWVGIAFEDVIMDCTDCRLVICMESNESNAVVENYYPTREDIKKMGSPWPVQLLFYFILLLICVLNDNLCFLFYMCYMFFASCFLVACCIVAFLHCCNNTQPSDIEHQIGQV